MLKDHLHVPLHVKTQMITPTEGSLTKLAVKRFITSMLSAIKSKLLDQLLKNG